MMAQLEIYCLLPNYKDYLELYNLWRNCISDLKEAIMVASSVSVYILARVYIESLTYTLLHGVANQVQAQRRHSESQFLICLTANKQNLARLKL